MKPYDALKKIYEDAHPFRQIESLLEWDLRVAMPQGAIHERIRMQQALHHVIRAQREREQMDLLLEKAKAERETLFGWDIRNFDLIMHAREIQNAMPPSLVVKLDQIEPQCQAMWPQAKREKNWDMILPLFREVVALRRERGAIVGNILKCSPYEALLFSYTRGVSIEKIDALFKDLRDHIKPIMSRSAEPTIPHHLKPDKEQQLTLCRRLVEKIGFDFTHGRIDVSEKAFHKWTDADSRIAVNIMHENFLTTIYSALHEAGHALHKHFRPQEWLAQPVGTPGDYCLREAMALIWQNYACREMPFVTEIAKEIKLITGESIEPELLYTILNQARPSVQRTSHGDANYMMHIIIRYEIERDLINGKIEADDVPHVWNAAIKRDLGLDVPDVGQGCLQDIHWYKGSFGYFPCYGLGHLYAAHLYHKAKSDIPDFLDRYLADNADVMTDFLSWHIYSKANSAPGMTIVENALGEPINPNYFIEHIKERG